MPAQDGRQDESKERPQEENPSRPNGRQADLPQTDEGGGEEERKKEEEASPGRDPKAGLEPAASP
jgi:hypothetical protein